MNPRLIYRCRACGNKTRFDVFEARRSRSFHHYSLGGELTIEEEEVLDGKVEKVVCRWCSSSDVESLELEEDKQGEELKQ